MLIDWPSCPADRVFVHALNTVKRIPRTGSARPPPSDRLKLYGLYKQSMEGSVEGMMKRPEGLGPDEVAEQEKWYAALHLAFLAGECWRRSSTQKLGNNRGCIRLIRKSSHHPPQLKCISRSLTAQMTSAKCLHFPQGRLVRSPRPEPHRSKMQLHHNSY